MMTSLIYFGVALIVTAVLTKLLIPFFRQKQFGQYIREEGPQEHRKKAGTPTMGGLAIIAGVFVGMLAFDFSYDTLAILLTMLAFGVIGFMDDYAKIAKKNNLGLTPKQKIALQLLFSLGIGVYMMHRDGGGTEVFVPFLKEYVDLGWCFLPFVIFTEVAMSNGVNLTDGLDGLATGVTAVVAAVFAVLGAVWGETQLMGSGAVIAGALLGFLLFNRYPARIFMGDTGSMALGGVLSAIAILSKTELLLPIAGIIYVAETLSVIIQVFYFKKTGGKRFFRMAPLHHHFELGGIREYNVVKLFVACTALCGGLALLSAI